MLRIAIARPSEYIEQALANWIAFTYTKRIRKEAPFIPGKMKAGELVRESPVIEEYKNLQRNAINAKPSSPYLKDALENPT